MERRRAPRRSWIIGRNELGQATLEWQVDHRDTERETQEDPLAQTYDFLEKLEVPDLSIEDSATPGRRAQGFDPYDTGIMKVGNLSKRR